ncbi:MAG: ATP-sensitive inward rectifier potassium channel 10 [Rhodospirillales bacterium]|nr:ATP-sensitive inward rectifier potassium channel 10 [Rhodospirillales bacterium]
MVPHRHGRPGHTSAPDPYQIRVGERPLIKVGAAHFDLTDPYRLAVTVSWPVFFACMFAIEILVNVAFALLYLAQPGSIANARPGAFGDAFFFSIETLATVGYGVLAPATNWGHLVSAAEIMVGLTFTALMTGLIFVRFSRPKPNVLFADNAVITQHDGQPTLMIRLAYARTGLVVGAEAHVYFVHLTRSSEGRTFRLPHELRLVRSRTPLFVLTWTLMHVIDEHSPLHGMAREDLLDHDIRLTVTVQAREHALARDFFEVKTYAGSEILFGMAYMDTIMTAADGATRADIRRIHLVEPDGLAN